MAKFAPKLNSLHTYSFNEVAQMLKQDRISSVFEYIYKKHAVVPALP